MLILKNKNLSTIKDVVLNNVGMSEEEFLNPPQNIKIKGVEDAKNIILDAVKNKEKITVVGDYDADGICASTILKLMLEKLGADYKIRLPRRFSEGYGLSEDIVDEINSGLLITVDNGIAAIDAIKKAKEKGLKVLLTDHHLPIETGEIPPADIVIDPNAINNQAEFCGYCGAGLAYKLAKEVIKEEDFEKEILQLACIATVADVVPLISENRTIVIEGLKLLNNFKEPKTTGLQSLLSVLDIGFDGVDEGTIGFKIAPAINAPGRLEDNGAEFALNVLSYNEKTNNAVLISKDMANKLVSYNEQRKSLKNSYVEILEKNIEDNNLASDRPLVIYQNDVHEGLVGILAGYFAEKYKTHCFVLTNSEEKGIIKGSARSYGSGHIKNALDDISDILYKYGGHEGAAGLSLKLSNLEIFKDRIKTVLHCDDVSDDVMYDIEISEKDIEKSLKELSKYAPYGEGNPAPVFMINDYKLYPKSGKFYMLLGKNGAFLKLNSTVNAVSFNCKDKYLEAKTPNNLKLVGTLSYNRFNGRIFPQVEFFDFEKIENKKEVPQLQQLLNKMAKK